MTDDSSESPAGLLRRGLSALGGVAPEPVTHVVEPAAPAPEPVPDAAVDERALAVVDELLHAIDESRAGRWRPQKRGTSSEVPVTAHDVTTGGDPTIGSMAESAPGGVRLVFTDGTSAVLAPDEELVIGRAAGSGRRALNIPQLSRGHVNIRASNIGAWATDLRSTNGTRRRRDGETVALAADQPIELIVGDELLVSSHLICVIEAVGA